MVARVLNICYMLRKMYLGLNSFVAIGIPHQAVEFHLSRYNSPRFIWKRRRLECDWGGWKSHFCPLKVLQVTFIQHTPYSSHAHFNTRPIHQLNTRLFQRTPHPNHAHSPTFNNNVEFVRDSGLYKVLQVSSVYSFNVFLISPTPFNSRLIQTTPIHQPSTITLNL